MGFKRRHYRERRPLDITVRQKNKPMAIIEVKASSNEGDMVLDPFAGCATTSVAAERLGRQWIAIDINAEAEAVVRQRLEREAQLPIGLQSWDRGHPYPYRSPVSH